MFVTSLTIQLILLSSYLHAHKVLIVGDSIDRFTVHEWCDARNMGNATRRIGWGQESIRYGGLKGLAIPSAICHHSNGDSIAFFHVFGSNPTGPYFHGIRNTPSDLYVDTVPRIKKALELYTSEFGLPDTILFQSEQWDTQMLFEANRKRLITPASADWDNIMNGFHDNVIARVNEIKTIVGEDVDVGLRTAAREEQGQEILKNFNAIVRNISISHNLTLYDFDREVWSSMNFEYENYNKESQLFRDWCHPKPAYTIIAGDKILGRQYSKYYHYQGRASKLWMITPSCAFPVTQQLQQQQSLDDTTVSDHNHPISSCMLSQTAMSIQLIQIHKPTFGHAGGAVNSFQTSPLSSPLLAASAAAEALSGPHTHTPLRRQIYFTTFVNGSRQRWGNVNENAMKYLGLTPADIASVTHSDMFAIPLMGHVPSQIFDGKIWGVIDLIGRMFVIGMDITQLAMRPVLDKSEFAYFNVGPSSVVADVDPIILDQIKVLPHISKPHSRLVRLHAEKQVYFLQNGTLHAIPSMDVFTQHGFDFAEVQDIATRAELDCFARGEDLQ